MDICPHCQAADDIFSRKYAEADLKAYLKNGPSKSTRLLLDAIKALGVRGASLLDVGGGIGAIQHDLAAAGAAHITDVDASHAFITIAQEQASKNGYADRATYHYGDFVELADQLSAADIVTLDRALCCYPDAQTFLQTSLAKARRIYGLVYPRDTWLVKLFAPVLNLRFRLSGNPFRVYIHPRTAVNQAAQAAGFRQTVRRTSGFWQVVVYVRD